MNGWNLVPIIVGIMLGIALAESILLFHKPGIYGVMNGFIGMTGVFFTIGMIVFFLKVYLSESSYNKEW